MTSFDMTELTHNLPSTSSSPSPWRSNTNTPAPYDMAPDRVTTPQPRTMEEFITTYADWQRAYATNKILAGLPPAMPLNVQQPSYTSPQSPPRSSISSPSSIHITSHCPYATISIQEKSTNTSSNNAQHAINRYSRLDRENWKVHCGKTGDVRRKQGEVPPMVENFTILPHGL